jgi:two-component system CheB/CheR fusion protein
MTKHDNPAHRPRRPAPKRKAVPGEAEETTSITEANESFEEDAEQSTRPRVTEFPIVGIGASAGGLSAFEAFFSAVPQENTGMAFVLVQHLSPDHKSILHEIVGRYTRMEVHEVEDAMRVKPNCAYIIPPNKDMALVDGTLHLTTPTFVRGGIRLPIDFFFRSLAQQQGDHAICVVLSGSGSDGTLGLRAIKGGGGMAMVQSPESTEHDGMPRSAIATGLVDYVLHPRDMPAQLIAYCRHVFRRARTVKALSKAEDALKKLCVLLRAQTGHDFSQYKEGTLMRRIERRMSLHQFEDPEEYLQYVRENVSEAEGLFRDLLIGVTNFFRDSEAYEAFRQKVLPRLFERKQVDETIRVWVCGCSTGEEAYSIAILLQEHLDGLKRAMRIQVFATDIDREAIEHARAGVYPASIAADVSAERLARYFVFDQENGTYRVQKAIRDLLVFSEQDVIRDPPFSKLDVVCCRNLLIYLKADLQKRLMLLFHYALQNDGVLFLGTSETVGEMSHYFSVLDRKWKLYQRKPDDLAAPRPVLGDFVVALQGAPERRSRTQPLQHGVRRQDLRTITELALLKHYAQAGILIDARGDVLYIVGRTGKFLEPASGDAGMNVVGMAREGLQRPMSSALHKATTHKEAIVQRGLRVRANGGFINVNQTVRPAAVEGAPSEAYLVVIEESLELPSAPDDPNAAADFDASGRIALLEQELRAKEDYLQTTLEEMETTNEELKSTNEEMQSVNEELQSTNEELETSKEELQSVNEELATVNAELQDKVTDLSRANNDMNNLLAGTGVGTLFVDHNLRISRFTPATTQVINLIHHDVGRPIEHVVTNLVGYDTLVADVRAVLESLLPREATVQTKAGAWYLMRIRPYRTMDNVIEGAVLTFFDISERRRAEIALRTSEARFQAICQQAFAGIAQIGLHGDVLFANEQFCKMLQYSREELEDLAFQELTHPEDRKAILEQFDGLIAGGEDFSSECRLLCKDGTVLRVDNRMNGIRDSDGKVESIVAITVVSERSHDGKRAT